MAPGKRLKANELVMLLAGLLNLDVEFMARVGNLPVRNLRSWLAGKKENLRPQSIVSLMSLLGLKTDNGIRLDANRVHFWTVNEGLFVRGKAGHQSLTAVSKLLSGCMITEVVPENASWLDKMSWSYHLVMGDDVRVVIRMRKALFRRPRVNPDVIKGAAWRDDNDHHTITTSKHMWNHLKERDLTTFEFDRIFYDSDESTSWNDVALMAREFGVTPADASKWLIEQFGGGQAQSGDETGDRGGIDIDGGGNLFLMVGSSARRVA